MAKFDHQSSAKIADAGISIEGRGVAGQAAEGLAGRTRSAASGGDDLDKAFTAFDIFETGRFTHRAEFSVNIDSVSRGTRGGGADEDPAVVFTVPTAVDEKPFAIVDDDGFRYIITPNDDGRFEIPVSGDVESARGLTQLVGRFAVRVIGALASKAAAKGAELAVRGIEEKLRPHRLRSFTTQDYLHKADPKANVLDVDPSVLAAGPSLLLIHGFNSASHNAFRFDRDYVADLHRRYGGRVAAFDHPSLCLSPRANAEWLANHLESTGFEQVDILAHSRGGLVARELLDILNGSDAIRSVVFVATPNNGTALADRDHLDGFISMAANLTSLVPDNPVTDSIGIGLEVVREWVLGTAFDVFTGIECANPGSEVLTRLSRQEAGETTLRAIASQYEPRSGESALSRAANFVMDKAFKGEANDLLVPTRSAYDKRDHFHVAADNRLVLDGSFGISHSTFWSERHVLGQLDQWLDPAIEQPKPVEPTYTDPAADFELATRTGDVDLLRASSGQMRGETLDLAAERVGGSVARSGRRGSGTGSERTSRGTVVVLPGIFGSGLGVTSSDGERRSSETIWFNKWALARGRFTALEYPDSDGRSVRVDGLMPQYAPLLTRLAESWDVHPFAYDWRLDIRELAGQLADFLDDNEIDVASSGAPVHLVGHSMGGLVARAFIDAHTNEWNKGRGRLVQLGTPNWGSFAMVATALGDDFAVRAIAAADAINDQDEIRRIFCSFPSIYQLLPSPAQAPTQRRESQHGLLYEDDRWHGKPDVVDPQHMAAAADFHRHMSTIEARERVVFVAGDRQPTPNRARIEASGTVSFGTTKRGDGRVAHDFGYEGLIADEHTFFVDARHGDLANDDRVLDAIDDLLGTGTTERLGGKPAGGRRGTAADTVGWVASDEVERSLGLPVPTAQRGAAGDPAAASDGLDVAIKLYLGGGESGPRMAPALRVRVVHCSMEQAKYAVAAGRYKGIPMEGAIAFLDSRLGGALHELQEFDLSPEDAGAARYVPPPDAVTYPKGAIVVGLGEFGQLSATQLTRAIERGTIEYALSQRGSLGAKATLGVSSVLIGTPGRYGLSVQGSIFATVQGVARAAARLDERGIIVDQLEFIELYEGKAEEAAMALVQLACDNRFSGMDLTVAADTTIDVRPGGRPGSGSYEESGAPWLRLQLHIDEPVTKSGSEPAADAATSEPVRAKSQTLIWTSLGRSSQASRLEVQVPVEEIRRHVRSAVNDPRRSGSTNLTLFEMLFPHDAKLELDERDNLHLLVDSSTAWIPWELVTGRDTNAKLLQPLARRARVLRQLIPDRAERPRRTFRPIGRKALVIGDPPGDPDYWPRLPGAREEARIVADILEANDYEVTRRIYDGDAEASPKIAAEIREAFFDEHYRVIHIAGHGTFDEGSEDPFANGVVIGPDEVLCAGHFEDRLVTPDLVFLNCCHIGRIDSPDSQPTQRQSSYAELAASTSLQLMKIGVRAVVAAGWAVDDRAASAFAETFYKQMTDGSAFGESVGVAREDAYDDRNNTWGAYQCYGDPDFQFPSTSSQSNGGPVTVLSAAHLVKQLKALETRAGDADDSEYADKVAQELRDLEEQHLAAFDSPVVREAFASAYAAAGAFDDAVFCYREAVESKKAGASIRAVEQLANLESRLAATIKRSDPVSQRRVPDDAEQLCVEAERRLHDLIDTIAPTPERLALQGSLHKRWANITDDPDQRAMHLRASRDAYANSAKPESGVKELSVYHGCLAVQMAHVAGTDDLPETIPEARKRRIAGYRNQLRKQRETMNPNETEGDYWERAKWIDIDATVIISKGQITDEAKANEIVDGFKQVFEIRSTARQRRSVIDHYLELSELLPTKGERAAAAAIAKRLADD